MSSPDEAYQVLMEECTFDLFLQTHGNRLIKEQLGTANELRAMLEDYYDAMPRHPDPSDVLRDPRWKLVRRAAQKFVRCFERSGRI